MPNNKSISEPAALALLLGCDLVLALIEAWKVPFESPTPQYLTLAYEFGRTHHIVSPFLSVGYAALMGLGYDITGSRSGMTLLNIGISLSMIVSAWVFLRLIGTSVRRTALLAGLLSVYPEFLLSYNKVQDTNITALLLFAFMSCVLLIARTKKLSWADVALAVVLSVALLIRPNMVLFVPFAWIGLRRFDVSGLLPRIGLHLLIMVSSYLAITTLVHGKPFLAQNGPYNLYAGYNPETIHHMLNKEDSIGASMASHGVTARINWGAQTDVPGINDFRDTQFEKPFTQYARQFIQEHPGTALELIALRFVTLLRPDFHVHKLPTVGGWFKLISVFGLPLWFLASIFLPQPGPKGTALLVRGSILIMVIPFLLTISAPRFCIPMTFVGWIDLGAILLNWLALRMPARRATLPGTSVPSPS